MQLREEEVELEIREHVKKNSVATRDSSSL